MYSSVIFLALVAYAAAQCKTCSEVGGACFPYASTGCVTNDAVWCEPKCPSQISFVFRFFSSTGSGTFTRNQVPSGFVGSRTTVFIVHGWQTRWTSNGWMAQMKDNLLARGNYNVIVVDWSDAGTNLNYPQPASETRTVGAEVAYVMNNLVNSGGAAHNRIHCIGHSLGSHVCGHAGMRSAGTMSRATGMDPAGPYFTNKPKTEGLNPASASFVDVIHTDNNLYGSKRDIGDADFYPADGQQQPGCVDFDEEDFDDIDNLSDEEIEKYGDFLGCSHGRAVEYMSISINNDCFKSRQRCSSHDNIPGSCTSCGSICATMGWSSSSSQRGLYRLDVNAASPYCQG